MTLDFTGEFGEVARQLLGDDAFRREATTVQMFEAPELSRLQSRGMAINTRWNSPTFHERLTIRAQRSIFNGEQTGVARGHNAVCPGFALSGDACDPHLYITVPKTNFEINPTQKCHRADASCGADSGIPRIFEAGRRWHRGVAPAFAQSFL